MRKRFTSLLLCACLMISILCGCANNQNDTPATATAPPAANPSLSPEDNAENTEAENVELIRIGMLKPNDTFSIFSQNGCFGFMNYNSFVGLNFWHFDENAELSTEGCFFRTWEVSDDGMYITLTYDTENLYWHDGVPVSDDDVVFSFEFWKKQNYPLFLHIENIEIPESGTCVVTFDSPMAFSFMNQSVLMYHFMPKHIWENIEEPGKYDGEDAAIGCGPYKLMNIDADAQVSYYEAVENYPIGNVTVDKVELHSFDNDASLIQAMINNDIDVMYNYSSGLDSTLVPLIENDSNIDLGQSLNSATYQMMFGFNQYPTDQLAIRKAVSYALDYELLRDTIAGAFGQVSSSGAVSPVCLGYDPSLPQNARDLTKAAEVLDSAGYADVDGDGFRELPDGSPMTIRIGLQTVSDFYKRNAEIIQINLAEAGIRAEVDEKTISDADYRTAQRMNGEYDIWLSMTTVGMAAWGGVAHYAAAVTITSGQRFGTYADPEYLAAYDAMSESRNYDEYITAFRDIQRMNSEAVPVIAFATMSTFFPYRTDAITGWVDYPSWGVINCSTWYRAVAK